MKNKRLASLLLAQSAFCIALVIFRNFQLGWPPDGWASPVHLVAHRSETFLFLAWNLLLAWTPFLLAMQLDKVRRPAMKWGVLALWLLFFPNAPYIITDLIHLHAHLPIPIWYDALMLFAAAWTGLLLGYCSLLRVESMLRRQWGPSYSRAFALVALMLCGFGVYLGRFLRWNSWDVLVQPSALLKSISGMLTHPPSLFLSLGVTILFSALLGLGYFTLYALTKTEM